MDDLSFSVITCSRHSSISLSQMRRAVGMTICSTVTKRLISIFALMGPIYATLFNEMSLKRVLTLSLKPFTKNFYISRNFFCPSGFRISSSSEIVSKCKHPDQGLRKPEENSQIIHNQKENTAFKLFQLKRKVLYLFHKIFYLKRHPYIFFKSQVLETKEADRAIEDGKHI